MSVSFTKTFVDPFRETTEDRIRKYLLFDPISAAKEEKQAKAAAISAEAEAWDKKAEEDLKIQKAKNTKTACETTLYVGCVNKIKTWMVDEWNDENRARKDEDFKEKPVELSCEIEKLRTDLDTKIDELRSEHWDSTIVDYIYALVVLEPDNHNEDPGIAFEEEAEQVWETVLTKADDAFDEQKKKMQEAAKKYQEQCLKAAEKMRKALDTKMKTEKALKKLSEIPITVEDKIQEIKDMLDMLLGKYLFPEEDPDSMDFDLDKTLGKLKAVVEPLVNSVGPIESLVGKIPVIADLASIMTMLASSASSGNQVDKDYIKKAIGDKPPEIDTIIWNKVCAICDDIKEVAVTLPSIMIDVIFQMIDAIVGMFEQICGIIGVPEIPYPLSLLPQCISLMPKIEKFIKHAAFYLGNAIKGMLKQKYAQIMALAMPLPEISFGDLGDLAANFLSSTIPALEDGDADKQSSKSKPETKKIDYYDVIVEKLNELEKNLSVDCYDRTDLSRILKSYRQIYNGSDATINKYISIDDIKNSDGKIVHYEPSKTTIVRKQGTPEDFKSELDKVFSSASDIEDHVEYDCIKKTKSVVGALYTKYESGVKKNEPNAELVFIDTIDS